MRFEIRRRRWRLTFPLGQLGSVARSHDHGPLIGTHLSMATSMPYAPLVFFREGVEPVDRSQKEINEALKMTHRFKRNIETHHHTSSIANEVHFHPSFLDPPSQLSREHSLTPVRRLQWELGDRQPNRSSLVSSVLNCMQVMHVCLFNFTQRVCCSPLEEHAHPPQPSEKHPCSPVCPVDGLIDSPLSEGLAVAVVCAFFIFACALFPLC